MILDAGYKVKQDGTKQNETEQDGTGLKILTQKRMLQQLQLPIALAQVKAGNNSKSLLNEIRQIVSLYQSREITEIVHTNIIKSIKI